MKLVIDTSAYVAFIKSDARTSAAVRTAETIFVPAIVYGELTYGFYKGSKPEENLTILKRFMNQERVQLVLVDQKIAAQYGRLRVAQEAVGQMIAPNDLWIAAASLHLELPLLTTDQDFSRIAGLNLL